MFGLKKKLFISMLFTIIMFTVFYIPHTSAASRDVVCAYIEHMSTIKWTPSTTFTYYNDISKIFRTGKTYIGIPYTDKNINNLKSFRDNLRSADDSIPVYVGPTENYIGINNAGAIRSAWSEISKTVKFTSEKDMFPSSNKGTVAVGDYDCTVSKNSTEHIVLSAGDGTMLKAYAKLQPGDAVFTYISDIKANSRFITQVNVVKNSDGEINGEKSSVIVTEQTGFESIVSNTTWSIGKRYTFNELLSGGYIPITCAELKTADDVLEAPLIYVEDFEGGKSVSISCDEAASVYYTTDGTTPSKNSTKYNEKIILTSSAVINAVAISDSDKSEITKRAVTVNETAAPQIAFEDSIMGKTVTVYTDEQEAAVYYSTDEYAFVKYVSPFTVEKSATLSFYAVRFGCKRSKTVQSRVNLNQVEDPVIISNESSPDGRKITFSCNTAGAKFYYSVDGSVPDKDCKSFYSSIVIASSCTLKVRAMKNGMGASKTTCVNIELPNIQAPQVKATDIIGGKKIELSCNTSNIKMYYTIDGTQPKITDTLYTKPFYIKKNTTVRVLAVKDGYESAQTSKKLSVATVSIPIIKADKNLKITLSCKTSGALIYYTLDGSEPNMLSKLYSGAFTVKRGTKVKAFAIRNGMSSSDTVNVTISSEMTTESTMTLSDYNYPTVLDYGQNYSIKGTVKSNYKISSVTVELYTDTGRRICEVTEYPNVKSIDISKLNNDIDFSIAPAGTNYYKITATDMQGSKILLNKSFTVSSPDSRLSALAIEDTVYPTALLTAQNFNVYGKITSNYIINNVTAGIFAVNGRSVASFSCKPSSTSFNLGVIGKELDFSKLKAGTYHFKIIAEDEAAKKTLLNKAFTVAQPTEGKSTTVNGAVFPDMIIQGHGFDIQGKVISSSIIKTVTAEISLNDNTPIHSKTVRVNGTQYDISMLSDYLFFEQLESGIYKLKLTSCDSLNSETVLISKEFIITADDSGSIMSIPDMYSYNYRSYIRHINDKNYSVASCGSSFVCMAMVKSYLNEDISPEEIFKYACDNDIFDGGIPTERQLLKLGKLCNIDMSLSNKAEDLISALKSGKPVIVRLSGSGISSKSEYVTVKGFSGSENGKYFYINSPSSPILSKKAISYDEFMKSVKSEIFVICG